MHKEAWFWSAPPPDPTLGGDSWGNLVQGMRLTNAGVVDGLWASTSVPGLNTNAADKCKHLGLRSFNDQLVATTQQAIQAVDLFPEQDGPGTTAVVLGCPGGRVRVVRPGAWRTSDTGSAHVLGTLESSSDLGHGGSALAVRVEGTEANRSLRIWFGTIQHPDARPQHYANDGGALLLHEVSAGAVHVMTWSPSNGFSTAGTPLPTLLHPTTQEPRGASAVVGMLLADLLPTVEGDELIVGTLSGDVIVYSADSMIERWRDRVTGSAGCYNAIRAEDLDGDGRKELYVAGSSGLWRFKLPEE